VRGAKGMVATPLALALRKKIPPLMESLQGVYQHSESADIANTSEKITIATTEYFEVTVLLRCLKEIRAEAKGLVVAARSAQGLLPKADLENGALDLAVAGYFGELPEGFYQQKLYSDDFVSAVHRSHPILKRKKIDLGAFAAYEHILVSPQGDMRGRVDDELRKQGLQRAVVFGSASFLSPAWFVSDTELVMTGPRSLLQAYQRHFPIQLFETPATIPKIDIFQVWHERTHRSGLHKWFRGKIETSSKQKVLY
jgi:DNA-binding transcriptional LysR family regulator